MSLVFIVDDHRASAEALAEVLQDEGHDTMVDHDPAEALARVRAGPPDVLITDLRMDGMDGVELLKAVHLIDPDLPVILVTAFASIDVAVQATRAGAFAFVTKPLQPEQVAVQVRNAAALRGLRRQVDAAPEPILGRSVALLRALGVADRAAGTDLPVLITGESGTGKELLARRVHERSGRAEQPFVPVNCGAIPETLIEAELFGAARGAYTGADRDREGLVAAAEGGTLFLDEVGELSEMAQVRLLRVLQESTYRRVGDTRERRANVRIVAATHRNLREGGFREDLYFRLAVLPVELPPLRARGDDVMRLLGHALGKACQRMGRPVPTFTNDAVASLQAYRWPGNVRELMNLADRLAVLVEGPSVDRVDLPPEIAESVGKEPRVRLPTGDFDLTGFLEALEEQALSRALATNDGVKARAAASLGLERNAFRYKLKKYGIDDP